MPRRDTVRGFTEIQCRRFAGDRGVLRQEPIWHLIGKTDLSLDAISSGITPYDLALQEAYERYTQGLLHVLHAGWLLSDNSRCLERLWNKYDLYRSLMFRFAEMDGPRLESFKTKTPARSGMFKETEHALKSGGPFALIKLRVAAKPIGRTPRAMPWNKRSAFIELVFQFTEDISE